MTNMSKIQRPNKMSSNNNNNNNHYINWDKALCFIPTWYRASTQHSTAINIAARPCSLVRAGAIKIDAIFLPAFSIVIQFTVPATS